MVTKFKQVLSSVYLRNVSWMAGAEIANRIIRLSSTVIIARTFSSQDYGLMAMIYTIFDLGNVFILRGGIGAKIIQADEQDVKAICNTAYWLNWITCSSLFIIQCTTTFLISAFSPNHQITMPFYLMAFTYLSYPLYLTHLTLLERENKFKPIAICNVISSLILYVLTATLALLGMGVWALIWSMLISAPFWIILTWKIHPWRPPLRFTVEKWQQVIGFGSNLLLSEILNRLRSNIDYLIVGSYLGIEALGMYYFAFNAGSGIAINLLNTFMSPLYPYICAVKNDYWQFRQRYLSSLKKVSLILVPLILLQAFLAPIYVPIVFGKKWIPAIPVLILVCLSVIPKIYAWAAALLLNAINKPRLSLYINTVTTIIFIASIFATVKNGIVWVAFSVFLNSLILSSIFALLINFFAFNKRYFLSNPDSEIK